jgi:predicted negative regulator of RcsB-dependent stress response
MATHQHRPQHDSEDRYALALEWVQDHAKPLAIGALALLIAGGGYTGYRYFAGQTEVAAERAYGSAQAAVYAGNLPLAQSDLEKVITRYGGTPAATQAAMTLAQTYYQQGKYAEGLDALEKADRTPDFAPAIAALRAAGLEGQGKFAEAGAAYLQAAEQAGGGVERDQYRSQAARIFTTAGDSAKAIELWKELAADQSSPYAQEATVRLGELQAAPAA